MAGAGSTNNAEFNDPRLAALYDVLDPDRSDLDVYLALAEDLGVRSVLDIGCGTGTLALSLVGRGIDVIAVDPAAASLDVARNKPGADCVDWILGDVTVVPTPQVDLVTMTANVAQVFITDDDWDATLAAAYSALRPGGHIAFETRDPADQGWLRWVPELSQTTTEVPGLGPLVEWYELLEVAPNPLTVTFRAHNVFPDGEDIVSTSTLRFRTRDEISGSLVRAGFADIRIDDLPYAPGRGWLVQACVPTEE